MPVRPTWPSSARKTPSWQVTEESTRIVVFTAASGTLRIAVCSAQSSGDVERRVKYMAKSPPKNMSSLASHTMVPTCTMFGRLGSPVVG